MRYIGGKSKLAKPINAEIRARMAGCHTYLEPFMGGGATAALNAPMFERAYAGDVSKDLILMWQAVKDGWLPRGGLTEDEYQALRSAEPSAQRGFAGFGCSFGGKWFGGMARGGFRSDGSPRDYSDEAARRIAKMAPGIRALNEIRLCDYRDWQPGTGWLVYADPPYHGTQGYGAVDTFISADFWSVMNDWAANGAVVLVSEYTAPDEWVPIWEKTHRRHLQGGISGKAPTTLERLYATSPGGVPGSGSLAVGPLDVISVYGQ